MWLWKVTDGKSCSKKNHLACFPLGAHVPCNSLLGVRYFVESRSTSELMSVTGRMLTPTLSSGRSKMVAGSQFNVPPLFMESHLTFSRFHTNIPLKCNCNQPVLFNAMPNCNGHLYYFQFSRSTVLIGYVGKSLLSLRTEKERAPHLEVLLLLTWLRTWPVASLLPSSVAHPRHHQAGKSLAASRMLFLPFLFQVGPDPWHVNDNGRFKEGTNEHKDGGFKPCFKTIDLPSA